MEQGIADPMIEALLAPMTPSDQQAEVSAQVEQQPVAPQPAPEPAPPPARQVPLPELMEERHKRQMAEREREAARRELAIVQQFMEGQRRQPAPPPIDPVADPEGAYHALLQQQQMLASQQQEQALHQRANMSEMLARRDHGSEQVDAAVQAAIQAGLNRNFMAQPDPYAALLQWHKANQVASEVGTDLAAYKAKIAEEVRAQIIAEARAAGRPVPQNLPPSLSTATRAAVPVQQVQDAGDFFKSMFAKPART